jgi:hypothetical protein
MASVPAYFTIGFTIPEISVYSKIPTDAPALLRRATRNNLLNAGRNWDGALEGLNPTGAPWLDDLEVDPDSGHADDDVIRAEINKRLLHLDADAKYTVGAPTADGVIYVWINGSRVCIHTFGLMESIGGEVSPVVHNEMTNEGPVTVGYWASLGWV